MGFFDRIERIAPPKEEVVRSVSKDIDFTPSKEDEVMEWGDAVEIELDEVQDDEQKKSNLFSRFRKKPNSAREIEEEEEVVQGPPKIASFETWNDESFKTKEVTSNRISSPEEKKELEEMPTQETPQEIPQEYSSDEPTETLQSYETLQRPIEPTENVESTDYNPLDSHETELTPIETNSKNLKSPTDVFLMLGIQDYSEEDDAILTSKDIEKIHLSRDTPVGYNLNQVDLLLQAVKGRLAHSEQWVDHHERAIASLSSYIITQDENIEKVERSLQDNVLELSNANKNSAHLEENNRVLSQKLDEANRKIQAIESGATAPQTGFTPTQGQMPSETSFDQYDDDLEDQLLNSPGVDGPRQN